MQVKIPRNVDSTFRVVTSNALQWLGNYLLGEKLASNITIRISFERMSRDCFAFTTWEDTNVRPREFNIALSKDQRCDMSLLKVLAHEMIHVMQYARNDLQDTMFAHIKKWCGKEIDTQGLTEDQLPWEDEAYELEYSIVSELVASRKGQQLMEYDLR